MPKAEIFEDPVNVVGTRGSAGSGGVGPLIKAKSIPKLDIKTDISTTNVVERELHTISDHCERTENHDDAPNVAHSTKDTPGAENVTTRAEVNKEVVTKKSHEAVIDACDSEDKAKST